MNTHKQEFRNSVNETGTLHVMFTDERIYPISYIRAYNKEVGLALLDTVKAMIKCEIYLNYSDKHFEIKPELLQIQREIT